MPSTPEQRADRGSQLALEGFEADDGIGCIVITGSEKAFAAGADIKEMQPRSYMDVYKSNFLDLGAHLACRKPIIAAVTGFALGGEPSSP